MFTNACLYVFLSLMSISGVSAKDNSPCENLPRPFKQQASASEASDNIDQHTFATLQGKLIKEVKLVPLPIFNQDLPYENRQIHRLANRLHRYTRPSTLYAQLTITAGEPFDFNRMLEAERRLRQNVYLSRVKIIPHENCDGDLVLWVFTQDSWSITPGFNYAQVDDETTLDVSLTDVNFMGLGHSLSIGHTQQESQSAIRGSYYAPRFLAPKLFAPGIDLSLNVTRGDWLDAHRLTLEKPFLTYDTRSAFGFSHLNQRYERNLYLLGQTIYRADYEIDQFNGYVGLSEGIRNNRIGRWQLGVTLTEQTFRNEQRRILITQDPMDPMNTIINPADIDTPLGLMPLADANFPNRERHMVWIEYHEFSDRFARLINIRNIKRIEDIPKGATWRMQLGFANDEQSDSDLVHLEAGLRFSPLFTPHHILQTAINLNTDWQTDAEALENAFITADLSYFWLLGNKQRIVLEMVRTHGKNITQDRLLTRGGNAGLRGYPRSYQLGNTAFRTTLEHRYYFQTEILNIFQFASAVYVDAGRAWFTENSIGVEEYTGDDTLWNMGIGLRIASTRIGFGSIAHIDLAAPMTDSPSLAPGTVGEAFDDLRFTVVLKSAF